MADELQLSDEEDDPLFGGAPRPSDLPQQQHGLLNGSQPPLVAPTRSPFAGGFDPQDQAPPHHHEPALPSPPAPPPLSASSGFTLAPVGFLARAFFSAFSRRSASSSLARTAGGTASEGALGVGYEGRGDEFSRGSTSE